MKFSSCVECTCIGCPRTLIKKKSRGYCSRCELCKDKPLDTYCKWREEKEAEKK